jgi:glycosyltransferase involved in cell wall biosynthesis
MAVQNPRVSVAMLCGNHGQHLTAAVDSALSQTTDFSIEIVIGDDCSTDQSLQLLRKIETDNPERVRILFHDEAVGTNRNFAAILNECHGQYVALLECDDYWLDDTKLQQQVDYLDQHPTCAICFHRVQHIDENGFEHPAVFQHNTRPTATLSDLLQDSFISTSSAVVRSETVDELPDWYLSLEVGDWPWFLLNARHGNIGYIDETLSVYRHHNGRRWHSADKIRHHRNMNLALRRFRNELENRFQKSVDLRLSELHRLSSVEMDLRWLPDAADRHRRMCFLYGGWNSQLPLHTRISHALRPCRFLHATAVLSFDLLTAPKRHAPFIAFLLSTIRQQPSWLLRLSRAFVTHGISGFGREWRTLDYLYGVGQQQYTRWIRHFDTLTDVDREAIGRRIEAMQIAPRLSVVMPVYNTAPEILKKAIASVVAQLYPNWELCIADDASEKSHVREILNDFQTADTRIRCRFCEVRGNISAASNAALELASGEFVVFMDHDDELTEHALYRVAEEINCKPDTQIIYSDQDRLDEQGRRVDPYFKTDWNPDLMLSHNLICHLSAFRRQLVQDVGGFRIGFEGGQDYDLALRCIEQITEDQIRHIPAVLYHWRQVHNSVSANSSTAAISHEAGAQAIREHLKRQEVVGSVEIITDSGSPHYRVRYALPDPPLVTVIIPTRDRLDLLKRCVEGLLNDTDYPNVEIMIVDNESSEPVTLDYFSSLRQHESVRIVEYKGTFNYSSINNFAVNLANGEVICLLNNDTEIMHADWLFEMVSHAVRSEIGAVGAKLLFPDDTIQHAGVLIGYGGGAGHTFTGMPVEAPVHFNRMDVIQDVSCVTAACLVLRKTVFDELGGLDEKEFAVAYNDVDLCLKIVSAGYRIVWTPYAQLYHHESASRGKPTTVHDRERDSREGDALRQRWAKRISSDPNLNPNISIAHTDYRPAFPPRDQKPWQ